MAAPEYRPVARLLSADGGAGGTAVFRVDGADIPGDARLLVISDDRDGRMYAAHPVGDHMRRDGDRLVIDIRAHIQRYYPRSGRSSRLPSSHAARRGPDT
jgi:hypothetical protein